MTLGREQEIRDCIFVHGASFVRRDWVADLLAALDAERVRCADLERERDEAVARARRAEWARDEWRADAKHLERERDGWKARAEQAEAERDDFIGELYGMEEARDRAEARVAVLKKALSQIRQDGNVRRIWATVDEALAVPGRPGSGAPAESESGYMDAGGWNS